ncbi:hypothetical protein PRZ48_011142 [Zasmidium cellare]|uniref:Uncharacterized protein n=1 Tax=Zasmidium cellare TaxID=395010 RepID=A0ABR0EAK8_ZASCE|nr:hypothetical protein PRZ48_011142 [Zasmidium cellare]
MPNWIRSAFGGRGKNMEELKPTKSYLPYLEVSFDCDYVVLHKLLPPRSKASINTAQEEDKTFIDYMRRLKPGGPASVKLQMYPFANDENATGDLQMIVNKLPGGQSTLPLLSKPPFQEDPQKAQLGDLCLDGNGDTMRFLD